MMLTTNKTLKAYLIMSLLVIVPSNLILLASEAAALCVRASIANLRQGPGTNFKKLWEVFKYMPLKKMRKKGDWFRVKDVDGDIYWIHKKLVTRSYKCAVVKAEKANFRAGPGTHNPQVEWSPMTTYFSMKVLIFKGKWLKIMDGAGDKAWVHRSLVWVQ